MPLFDAYTGPYKHKHRYWTGFLLLVRVVIIPLNNSSNPAVNLLSIAVITFVIAMYLSYVAVYKNWLHNILEIVHFSNLGFLSIATIYQLSNDGSRTPTTYISTSIFLFLFVSVVLYHALHRSLSLKSAKIIKSWLTVNISRCFPSREGEQTQNKQTIPNNCPKLITHTSIELTEPLIQ